MVKIPGTAEGVPRHPADDRRGPQHQRHADLQPRPLRRGDRGLPLAASRARTPEPAQPVRRSPAWPSSSSAGSTPRSTVGSKPSAHPRRSRCAARAPWPRASWPTSCSRRRFCGHRWEALAATGASVQRPLWASHVDQEPGLPRHALRRRADRPRHGQHAARRHDRGLRRPRHARPRASTPTSTRPTATWAALGRRRRRPRRRRRHARARGRQQLPEELRRAARRARHESHRAARLSSAPTAISGAPT